MYTYVILSARDLRLLENSRCMCGAVIFAHWSSGEISKCQRRKGSKELNSQKREETQFPQQRLSVRQMNVPAAARAKKPPN
jgi:hypothetical protein